ncbi:DUF3048 domain-containing protein [Candidatus Uhrbacteria bacterium]|nr:DUF3048 domain-containing protein [Candidatus Uhrbacteria bacterium]
MPGYKPKNWIARYLPAKPDRAVLRLGEGFWRSAAQWSALAFFLAVGLSAIGYSFWGGKTVSGTFGWLSRTEPDRIEPADVGVAEVAPDGPVRAVDGRPLPEGVSDGPYYAVTVDNHAHARPLSGLASAPLVYEVPAEGGITRFLAVYPNGDLVRRIGPVRSARPYFLDWAAEFDALYAHVGGSPESLEGIKVRDDIFDLNEYWNGRYFWRDTSRVAPHMIFTSTGLLSSAFAAKYGESEIRKVGVRPFKGDAEIGDRPSSVPDLTIDWSTPAYSVAWRYDREGNDYARHQNGARQEDEDGSPVRAKNVIVEFHDIRVTDSVGRRKIDTVGEGRAIVIRDGLVLEATWKKPAVSERTGYFSPNGEEIPLNVGQTWVEIVPNGLDVGGL